MRNLSKQITLAFILCLGIPGIAIAKTVKEAVYFIEEDGHSYTSYNSVRTSFSDLFLPVDKDKKTSEEALADNLYFYPNSYKFDDSPETFNKVLTPGGDRSSLSIGSLREADGIFSEKDDGSYKYTTWDKSTKRHVGDKEYFGLFFTGGIQELAYVWVFPKTFELLSHTSNVQGNWVRRGNAIAFFAKDVNNIYFEFEYRPRLAGTYESLSSQVSGEDVDVQQTAAGVSVTVRGTVLFPSGSAEVSESGRSFLREIASIISNDVGIRVSVNGHTDNNPIQGDLAQTFPSNWELSAARSLSVLRELVGLGVKQSILEARAYGEFRPVASNDDDNGRAQNRRIEIAIQPASE